MRLQAFGNYVVIEAAPEEQTKSGLFVPPDDNKPAPDKGTVVDVGADVEGITPGMHVVYKRYAADEVKIEDKTFFIIQANDVVAALVE